MQIAVTLSGNVSVFPGSWCIWNIIWGYSMWFTFMMLHIYYAPAMQRYINSQRGAGCICDAIEIGELDDLEDEADEEVKVAFEIAIAEREAECLRQCPPIASKCSVVRTETMTDYEYESECTA